MSTDLQTDWDAFNSFVDVRLASVRGELSLEGAVEEFRAYQRELADARSKVLDAKAASSRGESAELNIDELVREIDHDLASEGIRE